MKLIRFFLIATIFFSAVPVYTQDSGGAHRTNRPGEGAGYSTRDATVLSMMGWGVGLAVGIALLCGYLEQSTSQSH